MDNNLIPFPVNKKPKERLETRSSESISTAELEELRDAFDDARKEWPLELSELPECNRIVPSKVARS
ncbi:hypothetical protein [Marinomonas mediterranea]|jgi:hypothetical protein|uniref:Uncharacterized protein n=1 Tax=Marinomonas mediterranea (strain ATCC 700492 / JCM 21426 / NBRC 103028 / MMB-1) TaxID=717774 RepID=F2K0T9_MARM1|nr:hypothetical protein [Marinomonas mediterranea]ADZ92181.1 hypothetical protein Marme_2960 [Marinomonas mediterranea MMB-1]WCN10142.1 hypothetical protein GV055_15095 [Marinomonas mediterranea]WCN14187.1 hypothetical protein GV054_14880 [Marinomonas mediterranea]WCN18243.1 hypothetical protein GV053_14970 [Marinomonas mediterranea MMB-1]